ncbi:hypothetical protein LMH81_07195 [Vibrio lentus]|uniref:hypothetical protein n=1 Tax=Vibrio sp. J383 TaxID=2942997 RepID=UPI001E4B8B59|nr:MULTISPECIES: hypothetical protein [Vibrio]MCC4786478.1 hypothetical protein [Vibrio splendidus]MCC4816310.1 hypothetical protein [Vibrio lentus]UQV24369.1 hypothetical protein M4S28_19125 [Vibrio sp. J383]
MRYMWASFCANNPNLGRSVHLLVILLAITSIILPLVYENLLVISTSLVLALICGALMIFFGLCDKIRSEMRDH